MRAIFPGPRLDPRLRRLERILLHRFHDPELLRRALTHKSSLPETGADPNDANERLELLGDSVLDLIVVEGLWKRYPRHQEGDLSKLKAMLVSGAALHAVAEELHLGEFILMSESEARNGGRRRISILEDTLEALIAALYLDGGMKAARHFVEANILSRAAGLAADKVDINYKSRLLEFAQGRGMLAPIYLTTAERGPDHRKEFEVEVIVSGRRVGRGTGNSKKAAQQDAARQALEKIEVDHNPGLDALSVEDANKLETTTQ